MADTTYTDRQRLKSKHHSKGFVEDLDRIHEIDVQIQRLQFEKDARCYHVNEYMEARCTKDREPLVILSKLFKICFEVERNCHSITYTTKDICEVD